jgi:hypothetical protein
VTPAHGVTSKEMTCSLLSRSKIPDEQPRLA